MRTLSLEQRHRLLGVRGLLAPALAPRETLQDLLRLISEVVGTKVALLGRRETGWSLLVASAPEPSLSGTLGTPEVLERVGSALAGDVETWPHGGQLWTLVGLSEQSRFQVILLFAGDWTANASVLRELARGLLTTPSSPEEGQTGTFHDAASRRLTRALADSRGLSAVCDLVLRHAVEAVPSRIGSFAVPTSENELSIVSTLGYPRVLVEHLRITPGSGVIGSVFQSRSPMLVQDVASIGRVDRYRSRYSSRSFVSIPVVAGPEVLGVFSLTDRTGGGPYTAGDVETLVQLTAPAAIALARERFSREAHAYAQAAIIDPVSGLFNRRYFQVRLEEELQRAARQRTPVGLLMMDLDGFKSINDRYGHVAGDLVIRDVSEILRRSVRVFDVCTRFGGEEFAVMMPGGTHESTQAIAERVRQRVEAHRRSEGELASLRVTVSVGLAVSSPSSTARELVERADRALYHAKRSGKNRISAAALDGTVSPGS
jgi:diguanylate cyclase (GGDEF)-like protein